jgi:hypothetical protein
MTTPAILYYAGRIAKVIVVEAENESDQCYEYIVIRSFLLETMEMDV